MKRSLTILFLILLFGSLFTVYSQTRSLNFLLNPNNKKVEPKIEYASLFPVRINGKWGYINRQGQVKVEPQFDYAANFGSANTAVVQNKNLLGIINDEGKLILEPKYKKLSILSKGYISASSDSLFGIYKLDGTQIAQEIFTKVECFSSAFFLTYKDLNKGLMDYNGRVIVPNKYYFILKEDSSYFKVSGKKGMGLYSNTGKYMVSDDCENVDVVNNKVILFKKDSLWGAVDNNRDTLFPAEYEQYKAGNNYIILQRGNTNAFFSMKDMKIIISSFFDYTPFMDEFIICSSIKKMGVIDYSGKFLIDTNCTEVKYQKDYFIFQKNGLWGLASVKGKEILKPVYNAITITDNNVFKVYQENLWGLANSKGKVLYGPSAQNIDYINKVAKIYDNKKIIILEVDDGGNEIDRSEFENVGTINVNFRYNTFEQSRPVSMRPSRILRNHGWFLDTLKNKWGLMDSNGVILIQPRYKTVEVDETNHLTLVSLLVTNTDKEKQLKYGIVDHEICKTIAPVMYDFISFKDFKKSNIARGRIESKRLTFLSLRSSQINHGIGFTDEFRDEFYTRVNLGGRIAITEEFSKDIIDNYNSYYFSLNGYYPFNIERGYEKFVTCKGGRWGFVNNNGEQVVLCDYHFVSRLKKDRFIACKNDKWGVRSLYKTIVPFDYDYITRMPNSYDSLFSLEVNVTKLGLMDTNGRILTPCIYDEISPFSDGIVRVKLDSKFGYINEFGSEIISCEFDKAGHFSEGLAPAKQEYKWGYINESGKFAIEPIYRMAYGFHEGLAAVRLKSKFGYIDIYQNIVIPFEYTKVSDFYQGRAVVKKGYKTGVINKEGKWVIRPRNKRFTVVEGENLYMISKKKYGLVNANGKQITKRKYLSIGNFCEGLSVVKKGRKYGYIDTTGKVIISIKYDYAKEFCEGLAAVRVDSLWGFVNTEGKMIVEPLYTEVQSYSSGRSIVMNKGICQVINKKGEIVKKRLQIHFPFSNNLAVVKQDNHTFYIDPDGERVFNERFVDATSFRNNHAFVKNKSEIKKEYEFFESYMRNEDLWALINSNGIRLTGYYFSALKDLSPGFITYKIPQYFGIADHSGSLVLPAKYESVEYVGEGLFKVVYMNKTGYVKDSGDWLWEPTE